MNLPRAQHRPTTEQVFLDAGAVAPHPGRSTPPPAPSRDRVDLSQPLVDADAIAGLLCVKRKRIYELARRPDDPLPSVRIGRAIRLVRTQVEEWVAHQTPHERAARVSRFALARSSSPPARRH